jgi:hypothetical protein
VGEAYRCNRTFRASSATSQVGKTPIITSMDLTAVIEDIEAEISRLEKARALLTGHTAPLKRGAPPAKKRRTMSAEGRARIAAAQKKRWAAKKK